MNPRVKWMFLAIAVSSFAGVAASSVSLHQHYGQSASLFCDFGGKLNCDIVNRSIYSEISGIPVALIGIAGYATLLLLSTWYRSHSAAPRALLAASVVGLAFALRLTYVEGFVLAAWCVLCLFSLALILAITILSAILAGFRQPA